MITLNDGDVVDFSKTGEVKRDVRFDVKKILQEPDLAIDFIVTDEGMIESLDDLQPSCIDESQTEITKSEPWTSGFVMEMNIEPTPDMSFNEAVQLKDMPTTYPQIDVLNEVKNTIEMKLAHLKERHTKVWPNEVENTLYLNLIINHAKTSGYIEALEYVMTLI